MARSNRQLTQFAVNKISQYFKAGSKYFASEKAGNTMVSLHDCEICPRKSLKVSLFDKEIMEVIINPLDDKNISGVLVACGDFYDSKGRPSRTTRERLNGILDSLGENGFIPTGVRVFLREDGTCCIGKGEECKILSDESPKVGLLAHPDLVLFA